MKIINASDLKLYIMRHLLIDEDSTPEEIERQMLRAVDVQPAIDAKIVRYGQWECQKPCPVCGEDRFKGLDADIWADWEPPYCPNCGAKMNGG